MAAKNISKCNRKYIGVSGRGGGFPYVHGSDQTLIDAIDVLHHPLGKQVAGEVTHYLMHIDNDGTRGIGEKTAGFNSRVDLTPLPKPVLSDSFTPMNPAPFHAIRPRDIWVHGGQHGINVAPVERVIDLTE
jgi:hypothetical protein